MVGGLGDRRAVSWCPRLLQVLRARDDSPLAADGRYPTVSHRRQPPPSATAGSQQAGS